MTPCGRCNDSPYITGEKAKVREVPWFAQAPQVSASVQAAKQALSVHLQKVDQVTVQGGFDWFGVKSM